MPVPVTVHRLRIDREHCIARTHHRRHEQAPIGLGTHHHLGRAIGPPADQRVQSRHTGHSLSQPRRANHLASLVHHHHIVMGLRPVMTEKNQSPISLRS
jgi:hypothetical protein